VGRTAGVSHGREVPLLPILAYFREYFGIAEADSAGQARERISDRLIGLDPAFTDDLPLLFDFLEVPDPERPASQMAAEVRMRRIFEVLRRVTAAAARGRSASWSSRTSTGSIRRARRSSSV
jgi:hypothetical protein